MKKAHWLSLNDEFLLLDENDDVLGDCILASHWEWWAYSDSNVKGYGIELTSEAAKAEVEGWLKRHGIIDEVIVSDTKKRFRPWKI